VSTLPGSDGPVDTEEEAQRVAASLGYPVIIKASNGGGGRGMRIVRVADELPQALRTAQREAQAAFGIGDVYLEKYLEAPRHIEVQILGDEHGNVVHLGERECSVQRRHQKLIEEAPSAVITEKQRKALGKMDAQNNLFFIEANTRLQVEHGVTELVTGIDIVKEQIRVAAGERLSFKQNDIAISGHAIECRVNAENPDTFAPSPGRVDAFSLPGGPGIRVDTFVHAEATVPPNYDSLIAKVMSHGRTRDEAIARMRRALEMTVIEGIHTSVPMHLRILADQDFQQARISTSFMERFLAPKPAA
jgi:acetyl-CoA carboxylase biotin carboxylase subunit